MCLRSIVHKSVAVCATKHPSTAEVNVYGAIAATVDREVNILSEFPLCQNKLFTVEIPYCPRLIILNSYMKSSILFPFHTEINSKKYTIYSAVSFQLPRAGRYFICVTVNVTLQASHFSVISLSYFLPIHNFVLLRPDHLQMFCSR
jgi:hypothetical protein